MADIQVISRTQRIVVNHPMESRTVVNAGPQGPPGMPGPPAEVPTQWTGVTFQNNWVDYGGAVQLVQYRKIGDIVYVRGVMKNGILGSPAFTLPVGFRPPMNMNFIAEAAGSSGVVGAIGFGADGTAIPQSAFGTTGAYFATNVSFSTTP